MRLTHDSLVQIVLSVEDARRWDAPTDEGMRTRKAMHDLAVEFAQHAQGATVIILSPSLDPIDRVSAPVDLDLGDQILAALLEEDLDPEQWAVCT